MTSHHHSELTNLLDRVLDLLEADRGIDAIDILCQELSCVNADVGEQRFRDEIIPACRSHRLFSVIQQDPYSARAFHKPRGYAGDAVMLDFVYDGNPPADVTALGKAVFLGTTRTTNGLSVLHRRNYLSQLVNDVSRQVSGARVCSLAAGHLREAAGVSAIQHCGLQEWLAIDQDGESLEVVQRDYHSPTLRTLKASVVDLIRGKLELQPYDLIYSAGLFDYLNDRLAAKTADAMFRLVRPGGRLVISNFTPESAGRHFMQAFMDWELIYRDHSDMLRLTETLPESNLQWANVEADPYRNIAYLTVLRN
ncbi:MAG: class I SAM-dependent methyltransferase [Planctomyces sp.]|nr:class I SAM-dependent methyltransferase [Planctomyces sp.]